MQLNVIACVRFNIRVDKLGFTHVWNTGAWFLFYIRIYMEEIFRIDDVKIFSYKLKFEPLDLIYIFIRIFGRLMLSFSYFQCILLIQYD